jgi:hypothetical protein
MPDKKGLKFLSLAFVVPQRFRPSVRLFAHCARVAAFSVFCCLVKVTYHILFTLDYRVTLQTEEAEFRLLITGMRLYFLLRELFYEDSGMAAALNGGSRRYIRLCRLIRFQGIELL